MLPEPWSPIIAINTATFLPFKADKSIFFTAAREEAEINSCSTAKRLPPPCAGMPVKVPQAVSVKRESDKVKWRSVREIIWCVLRTGEIATPDFIRLAMTGVFSGCLKDKKKEVKQLCLFAVCCLLFAHYYTLNETFYQSYLIENIEKNGFYW